MCGCKSNDPSPDNLLPAASLYSGHSFGGKNNLAPNLRLGDQHCTAWALGGSLVVLCVHELLNESRGAEQSMRCCNGF